MSSQAEHGVGEHVDHAPGAVPGYREVGPHVAGQQLAVGDPGLFAIDGDGVELAVLQVVLVEVDCHVDNVRDEREYGPSDGFAVFVLAGLGDHARISG
ncbi:hypothetical protein [Nocardia spumae]|uniref:hypothetical protein n=1 Tax=Nocardia spumae TaxID=2887190 RepID=UPI001D14042D|nr:hypothetical protein [Nocardia spumae]